MKYTGLLTIDLEALVHNWHVLSIRAGSQLQTGAVVKANAYGLGASKVAEALYNAGCRWFFVVTLAEARQLRKEVEGDYRIVVFGGLTYDDAEGVASDWSDKQIPVLFDSDHIERWSLHSHGRPCFIKIDTGMHRLGLLADRFQQYLQSEVLKQCNPIGLMSHFACADTPGHPLNGKQKQLFDVLSGKAKKIFPDIQLSLANSSGIYYLPENSYDIARPGAALYGVNPTPEKINPMKPVVRLRLPIIQTKTIPKGDSVGYGADFIADRETRLAIVFGGYADGLMRILKDHAFAYCENVKVPLVGRVSMDSVVFDITEVDEAVLAQGYLEVLNDKQTVDDLASAASTIGYEVLTSLGPRYHRCYLSEQ